MTIEVGDERLHASLHEHLGDRAGNVVGLFLAGSATNRAGPHRLHLRIAKALEACGIPSCRFDYRGRGESTGSESEVSVPSIIEDTVGAADHLRMRLGTPLRFFLICNCVGCIAGVRLLEIDPDIRGGIFLSAPHFSEQQDTRSFLREAANIIRSYAKKLAVLDTWLRVLRFDIDYRAIVRATLNVSGRRYRSRRRSDEPLRYGVEPSLPGKAAHFIWGQYDPSLGERSFYRRFCQQRAWDYQDYVIMEGDRSFSSDQQVQEVITLVCRWLGEAAAEGTIGRGCQKAQH